ncbi:hypothetical protein [Piscibacillus halophilus]|uniref:Sensor histidine kinase n=1 Tax=Piscibacillus halophilus TaxID=571933 RepID=A0A1H9JTZ8_9BACI|nr:hypothetical protein [Piscibacillus halophilus]SEQ90386.1 hypothetical protein SAMN05216362_13313 [Piscibacillus halophilus]
MKRLIELVGQIKWKTIILYIVTISLLFVIIATLLFGVLLLMDKYDDRYIEESEEIVGYQLVKRTSF